MSSTESRYDADGRTEYPKTVMSNFDHEIDIGVAVSLQNECVYARYPAENFHGYVWWEGGAYHCEVWRHHELVETISGTLQEIMDAASERWGDA